MTNEYTEDQYKAMVGKEVELTWRDCCTNGKIQGILTDIQLQKWGGLEATYNEDGSLRTGATADSWTPVSGSINGCLFEIDGANINPSDPDGEKALGLGDSFDQ